MAAPPADPATPDDDLPGPEGDDDSFWELEEGEPSSEEPAERRDEEDLAAEGIPGEGPPPDDEPAAPDPEPPPAGAGPDTTLRPAWRFEVVALGIGALILIVGVVVFLGWAIKGTSAPGGDDKLDFPIKGERVTIKAAETYWRKPNREQDEGVRHSTRIIPAGVVELGPSQGTGALRFFFEDEAGSTVGDPVTLAVADGSFTGRNTARTEIHATAGFTDVGDHAAYLTDQIGTWYLVVKEGPGPDAPGRSFKDVVRVPISKQRR